MAVFATLEGTCFNINQITVLWLDTNGYVCMDCTGTTLHFSQDIKIEKLVETFSKYIKLVKIGRYYFNPERICEIRANDNAWKEETKAYVPGIKIETEQNFFEDIPDITVQQAVELLSAQ